MYIPYVYLIKNKTTGLKYVGVEYSCRTKIAHPNNLWNIYFTSSKSVHKLIDVFGKDDFLVRILHKYPNDPESAIQKEAEYFKLIRNKEDYINLCYSSGIIDLRISSRAGKIGGAIVKATKTGIFRSEEDRRKWASMGGKIGGKKQAVEGLGFHQYKTNSELHKKWASKGGKASGQFQNKEFQSEMGKRGGVKNKGFVWLTNGTKTIKYTRKMQKQKSIEDFCEENNFRRGRT